MSQDDTLRMAAEVVDKFSPTLRNLRSQMQGLAREGGAHSEALAKGFGRVEAGARSAERAVSSGLNPALATIGVTSLSATAAIAGIAAAVRRFATSAAGFGALSRETGQTAENLRNFGAIASKFGIDQGAVAAGTKNFAAQMREFGRGIGETYTWLNRQGRDAAGRQHFQDFAADLRATTDRGEQLRKVLRELENIKDPTERGMFAEHFFGSADFGRLGDQHFGPILEMWNKTAKKLGPLDPETVRSAEEFEKAIDDLGSSMSKLGMTIGREFLPYTTQFTTWLDGIVAGNREDITKALREGIAEIRRELDGIDWRQAGENAKGFLTGTVAFANDTVKALRAVADVLAALKALKDGDVAGALKRLGDADRGTDLGLGKDRSPGTIQDSLRADTGPLMERQSQIQREMQVLDEIIARKESQPDPVGEGRVVAADERQKRDRLIEETKKLGDEIRRLREDQGAKKGSGEATAQPSAFNAEGGQFGGARVQTASLGGLAGAARVGRALGGGNGIVVPGGRDGAAAPSDEERQFGRLLEERGVASAQRPGMMEEFRRRRGLDPNSGAGRAGKALRGEGGATVARGSLATNQQEAYAAARAEGLSDVAARALVANMSGESLRNPRDHHWDRKHMSQGIVQWDPERAEAIRQQFGAYPKDMSVADQTRAAIWEINNNKRFGRTARALKGNDPDAMLGALVENYETPQDTARALAERRRLYRGFTPNGGTAGGGAPNAVTAPRTRGYQPDGSFYDGRWTYRRGVDGHMTRGPLAGTEDGLRQIKPWTKVPAAPLEPEAVAIPPTRVDMEDDGGMYAGTGALKKDPDTLPSLDDMLGKEAAEGVRRERLNEQWRRAQAIGKAYDTGDFRGAFVDEMKRRAERGERYGQREDEKIDRGGDRGTTLGDLHRHLAPDPFTDAGGDGEDRSAERFSRAQGRVTDPAYKPDRELTLDEIRRKYAASRDAEDKRQKSLQLSPAARGALRSGAGVGAPGADGQNGRVDLHVINPGPNTRVEPKATGSIFRDIKQTRGRPMAMGGEDV